MKKRIVKYVAAALLIGTTVNAQPVLTYANVGPLVGPYYQILIGDSLDPGPSGPGQTWDFTGFVSMYTELFHYIQADQDSFFICPLDYPYDIAGGGYISTADHAFVMQRPYLYYPGGTQAVFIENFRVLEFPMAYGQVFDNWRTFKMDFGDPCNFIVSQSPEQIVADGYGTVILPFGTFGPVLRVHLTGSGFMSTYVDEEAYRYYLPGLHYPLVTISKGFTLPHDTVWQTRVIDPAFVGLDNLTSGPSQMLYPVPVSDRLHWESAEGGRAFVRLVILDAQGRDVGAFHSADARNGLDVRELDPGIYTLFEEAKGVRRFIGRFTKQ